MSFSIRSESSREVFRLFSRFSAFDTSPSSFNSSISLRILSIIRSVEKNACISSFVLKDCALFSTFFKMRRPICSNADVRLFICSINWAFFPSKAFTSSFLLSEILIINSSKSANLLSSSSTCTLTLVKYSSHFSGEVAKSRKLTMLCSNKVNWARKSATDSLFFNESICLLSCARTSFSEENMTDIFSTIRVACVVSSIFRLFRMSIRSSSSDEIDLQLVSILLASITFVTNCTCSFSIRTFSS